jgi:pimeloyl-ACP methyl ester carboxylesterase
LTEPLHCTDTGNVSDITLFLIHAIGGHSWMWEECTAIWSREFRVVACDLRGAGRTPAPERPWRPADHVCDLETLRSRLDLHHVVPIGCASGAFIAASYAAAYPAHVAALVLSDGTSRLGESSRERVERRLDLIRKGGMDAVLPEAIDLAFSGMPKDARYHRYTERFRQNDPHGYAMLALGMLGSELTPALLSIDVPSLVLVGRHDPIYPPEKATEIHKLIKGSEMQIIEDAAHFPPYQVPERFAEVVQDFLDRRLQTSVRAGNRL